MSFPSQSDAPRRGGGKFFLLVFVFIAIVIFSRNAATNKNEESGNPNPNQSAGDVDWLPDSRMERNETRPAANGASSDWGQEDVAVQRNTQDANGTNESSAAPSRTQNGDWAQEDVDPKKDNNGFQFSTSGNGASVEKPKQTQSGDWGQEDVETDPKSPPTAKPKKTQNGDWGQEDVDPKKGQP